MTNTALTIFGFSIIFISTAAGAALVFFFKKDLPEKLNTLFLGFAAGVMTAASVWSLLIPAIDGAESWGASSFVPAVAGFLLGGAFLVLLDKLVPHIHRGTNEEEGPHVQLKKSSKLFLAVTIHNIPEGLAVGFAFGAAAVALPMKAAAGSRAKAFLYGAGSGAVEPVFATVGYFLAANLSVLQPWLLSFAAGAMIFVVAEDLIPDSKLALHPHLGTWGVMLGFAIMMSLDVALG